MLVSAELAKEKLARLVEVFNLGTLPYDGDKIADAAQLIRNTDLTDCHPFEWTMPAPDQGSVRNATDGLRRYEYVRTLNPVQFQKLWTEALGKVHFDDLVDAAIRALPDQKD